MVCGDDISGAAEWKRMSDVEKAPWQQMYLDASAHYAAVKPSVANAKPTNAALAKPKAKNAVSATKPKSKVGKQIIWCNFGII